VVVSKPASHRHKAGGEEAKVALSNYASGYDRLVINLG